TMLTSYAGLSPLMKYLNKMKLGQKLNELFPTIMHNATKFTNAQIMMSIVLASFSGLNRLIKIANFTCDALVMALLGLDKELNKDVISTRLKELGQRGAFLLHEFTLSLTRKWLEFSQLTQITIDADSTVTTVYGHQEGAAKGYNNQKKGAKSYHPLLAFVSELKLVANTWFRTGSAYTSNGICEFVKQTAAILPSNIENVFFRADSGFFSGTLFDVLETLGWSYLVKVKLKNLKKLLESQQWHTSADNPNIAICEFSYQSKNWSKSRKLRAIRTIVDWKLLEYFGHKERVPVYEYACYCSTLEGNAFELHQIYNQRSESETWIEQVKSQLLASKTLTNDFHANDILWQLNVMAYNLSVMMRYKAKKFWHQEHATFRAWFINVPGKLVKRSRYLDLKIYQHYYFKNKWKKFEALLETC
ncbi:MAG: IS1380 family transposase, partial [bacterium]